MAVNGEDVAATFQELGDLEKEFAGVELEALRRKEYSLKPLYTKRHPLLQRIPEFWQAVFLNGPEEVQQLYAPADLPVLSAIKSFSVERYQIESETTGEPRSLRFTFEFEDNEHFEATKLVKEFEYKASEFGAGSLISKPVPIKWKHKRKDLTTGLLDAAVELYQAEEAMKLKKGGKEIDLVEREGLWQHEKLREKIEKFEEQAENEPSFMSWFGFRGAIAEHKPKAKVAENGTNGNAVEDDESDDDDAGMLDVDIFPAGEEVAICLAEDLWPNVMDYFMRSQEEDLDGFDGFGEDTDDDSEVDGEAPELVGMDEKNSKEGDRPSKRQRLA